jgi:outer membrane protein OmpA-like peptidoglycan-associated protein
MKMNVQSLIMTSCLVATIATAQEGMELKINSTIPPTYYHQANLAAGFSNANAATVDLFAKNGKSIVGVPANYVGSQDAVIGDNYFGLITYYGTSSLSLSKAISSGLSDFSADEAVNYAEFIQTALPSTLGAGKEYEVSFKVSLADMAGFATSGWGAYFSDNALMEKTNQRLTVTPQVSIAEMVKDKSGWVELKGKFMAKGTEKFITIGVFGKDYKLESVGSGSGFAGNKSYYYLSSIMVKEVPMDRDKDGVLDKDDKCPDVFGLKTLMGCPDTDNDGIADGDDKCPTVAGLSRFAGCPDTDGDGIADAEDKCPTVAGIVANNGCPADKPVELPALVIDKKSQEVFTKAMTGIQFESGKDVIKKTSYGILDNVVGVLKANPSWKTNIDGHTDNAGKHDSNVALSQKRAVAVKKYLTDKGVTNELTPQGFGPDRPVADNKTPAGKAKNRRVEFKVTYMQ